MSSLRHYLPRLTTSLRRAYSTGHPEAPHVDEPYNQIPPIVRVNEATETKRARLLYQSRKRGILETDLLLSTFAKAYLPGMSPAELTEFDSLMDYPDWDIYYWSTGSKAVPPEVSAMNIFPVLQEHTKNKAKVILSMPALDGKK
jgi:succinate dehydrogenase assembly factor 2